ncbi:MAG: DUF3142 domain-containing protein [Verrucomicrobiota bacterium]|nr:DUF3142 domain-containing protein [Verrucomicrobiota bacterium]MDQ6938633.1 DUF3142 domain-containing protein [Verrucomicrobiota bacterium]
MKSARPLLFLVCALFGGCERYSSGPMPQRGYLWQREWTPATEKAFSEAERRLDGVIILAGEVIWDGTTPHFSKGSIHWDVVANSQKPIALALRIAPFNGRFETDAATSHFILETAKSVLVEANEHGARISEFQIDFDCAQKKLADYRSLLHSLGEVVRPTSFSITALPAWLDEPEFVRPLSEVDNYVLQVHSVPTIRGNENAVLCDPKIARKWVTKAARLGRPFCVALPTYRCLAGYDENGKLLNVAMDSVQSAWPGGTRVLEFGANPDEIAVLIAQWRRERSPLLRDLIWYRVPTDTDARNWRWPTLAAVMDGHPPKHKLEVVTEGENPIDLVLVNQGEADEQFAGAITVEWDDSTLVSSDALPGRTLRAEDHRATFAIAPENALRLSPGERRGIGWLRYDRSTKPRLSFATAR